MSHAPFVTSVMLLAVAGCASRRAEAPQAAGPPAAVAAGLTTPEGPVIVRLVGRSHPTITVTSSPDGPRYSARGDDGRMIVRGATLDELRANHPELARFVVPAVAVHADDAGTMPDAFPVQPDARRDAPSDFLKEPAFDARR